MRIKLGRRAADPAPAEEKHDGGTLVVGLPARRQEHVELEGVLGKALVDNLLVGLEFANLRPANAHREEQQSAEQSMHHGQEFTNL